MERRAEVDFDFAARLDAANASYAADRDASLPEDSLPRPSGGVGGTSAGVKCLHAHYAHSKAGGDNPVGEMVSDWIEPLDCETACVTEGFMNPDWTNNP